MNLMFESAIRQGKALPSFARTSPHEVRLTLHGTMTSPAFVLFIERLGDDKLKSFSTYDFLALDYLRREQAVPEHLKASLPGLISAGAVESIGRGQGTRYILARGLYAAVGGKGIYTRQKGLDRGTNKALLLKHIQDNAASGAQMEEFQQVLPALSRSQIQVLLRELRREGYRARQSRSWDSYLSIGNIPRPRSTNAFPLNANRTIDFLSHLSLVRDSRKAISRTGGCENRENSGSPSLRQTRLKVKVLRSVGAVLIAEVARRL